MSIWDEIHKARFYRKAQADEVTCDDCGETFPLKTEEQREKLEGGCPNCANQEP